MRAIENASKRKRRVLPKCPTGITGLDDVTEGGLPRGRPTLVCGGAGCGKSLLAAEFLVHGITRFDEPGVLMSFEESAVDIVQNVASLGFDLNECIARKKLLIDHVRVERNEIEETGEFDLDGLFIRLDHAIDSIGAKRVVLDTIESLYSGLLNHAILRAELRRLFDWLKQKKVTAVITGERGEQTLTRQGLEEYVSDCVILLDHRITNQVSTRRLRVVKYRGSTHGTNEYPFLIDEEGISVLPVTSLSLDHEASSERISSGVKELDKMLAGEGYFRGSSVLVSGTAGTGKSSLAAHFANSVCSRGEKCLYFAFEESAHQIIRNMRSIGIDLAPWIKNGRLIFHAARPQLFGLEAHLDAMQRHIQRFKPDAVIVDPVSNLINVGSTNDVHAMLLRLIDLLKMQKITSFMTSLTSGGSTPLEVTEVGISSLMDTWLLLRDLELNGERNRGLYVLKSRGMKHSNQVREFILTDQGVRLVDVYLGGRGVLTGSARLAQQAQEKAEAMTRQREIERTQRDLQRRRKLLEMQIATLQAEYQAHEDEATQAMADDRLREQQLKRDEQQMAQSRQVAGASAQSGPNGDAKPRSRR